MACWRANTLLTIDRWRDLRRCRNGVVMWEATVRVTREQEVDADPERVWALASSPPALAAMPGHRFAFAVPAAVPGTDRLCCMIVSGRHGRRLAGRRR